MGRAFSLWVADWVKTESDRTDLPDLAEKLRSRMLTEAMAIVAGGETKAIMTNEQGERSLDYGNDDPQRLKLGKQKRS